MTDASQVHTALLPVGGTYEACSPLCMALRPHLAPTRNATVFEYLEEFPMQMLAQLETLTGRTAKHGLFVINMEYGRNFSGPDKDVFFHDRSVGHTEDAWQSNFLHPVIYYYRHLPTGEPGCPRGGTPHTRCLWSCHRGPLRTPSACSRGPLGSSAQRQAGAEGQRTAGADSGSCRIPGPAWAPREHHDVRHHGERGALLGKLTTVGVGACGVNIKVRGTRHPGR